MMERYLNEIKAFLASEYPMFSFNVFLDDDLKSVINIDVLSDNCFKNDVVTKVGAFTRARPYIDWTKEKYTPKYYVVVSKTMDDNYWKNLLLSSNFNVITDFFKEASNSPEVKIYIQNIKDSVYKGTEFSKAQTVFLGNIEHLLRGNKKINTRFSKVETLTSYSYFSSLPSLEKFDDTKKLELWSEMNLNTTSFYKEMEKFRDLYAQVYKVNNLPEFFNLIVKYKLDVMNGEKHLFEKGNKDVKDVKDDKAVKSNVDILIDFLEDKNSLNYDKIHQECLKYFFMLKNTKELADIVYDIPNGNLPIPVLKNSKNYQEDFKNLINARLNNELSNSDYLLLDLFKDRKQTIDVYNRNKPLGFVKKTLIGHEYLERIGKDYKIVKTDFLNIVFYKDNYFVTGFSDEQFSEIVDLLY